MVAGEQRDCEENENQGRAHLISPSATHHEPYPICSINEAEIRSCGVALGGSGAGRGFGGGTGRGSGLCRCAGWGSRCILSLREALSCDR